MKLVVAGDAALLTKSGVSISVTETDRRVRKEDIKVRFIEPDRIEIELHRRPPGEEIPIE